MCSDGQCDAWESPLDMMTRKGMALPSEDAVMHRALRNGWSGTHMENWITSEFMKVIVNEYPEAGWPQ